MRFARALVFMGLAAGATAATAGPDLAAVERAVFAGANDLRAAERLPPLERNAQLEAAAREFALFMADHDELGHEADGRTPEERARAAGYRPCMVSENVAYEMRTRDFATAELAERLTAGWAASPGHRRNLLDADAVDIGIAVAHSEETSRYYAVQLFGRPESRRTAFEVRNESNRPIRYEVGGKAFTLQARAVRQHQVCGDTRITFEHRGEVRTFRPAEGGRFTVTPEGTLQVGG